MDRIIMIKFAAKILQTIVSSNFIKDFKQMFIIHVLLIVKSVTTSAFGSDLTLYDEYSISGEREENKY